MIMQLLCPAMTGYSCRELVIRTLFMDERASAERSCPTLKCLVGHLSTALSHVIFVKTHGDVRSGTKADPAPNPVTNTPIPCLFPL